MQQATPDQLDWEGVPQGFTPPAPLDLEGMPTIASIFGVSLVQRMRRLGLGDPLQTAREEA